MQNTLQDLRFALRQLRRSPGFAITAVLTLALGVGANTAIFSLLDQALLRSLPVRDPQQLVILEGTGKVWEGHTGSHGGDVVSYFSYPMYRDLRDQNHSFEGLIAVSPANMDVVWKNAAQLSRGEVVSGNYFSVLGVQPYLGRLLTQHDDTAPDANAVAVLSFDFWKNHLGADPSLIGQTLSLNGHPFEIVGVASPGFHSAVWGQTPALFVPMSMLAEIVPGKGQRLNDHKDRWLNIVGRLRDHESILEASTASAPLWHALRAEELKVLGHQPPRFVQEFLTDSRLLLLPGASGLSYSRQTLQKPLLIAMGMAVLVLLISSINVASLLLVRSASRVREFSLRVALGARNGRVVRQLLIEGLLIGLTGGAIGLAFAPLALRVLVRRLSSGDGPAIFASSLDARVLLFNFAIALAVSLCFSLAPTLQLRNSSLTTTLRESSATSSGSLLTLRSLIVCLQIGLSVLLLVASGLMVRTMQQLRAVDVGFSTTHTMGFGIRPDLAGYTPERMPALQKQIVDALSAIPGVAGATATDDPLLTGSSQGGNIMVDGYTPAPDEDVDVEKSAVNANFFATMQVPLLAGRLFTEADSETSPKIAIVNESFARRYFGNARNALGHRVMEGASNKPTYDTEIVGVVHDYRHTGIRELPDPTLYRPSTQSERRAAQETYFYLRTTLDPTESFNDIRQVVRQIDPSLAINDLNTMQDQIEDVLRNDSTITLLALSFGILATLLAGIGVYGVLAYATTQRTREIGIRMALGAQRQAVIQLIVGDMAKLAGIAILVALPLSVVLSRVMRSQLFEVSTFDPLALAVCVAITLLMVLAAAVLPAVRAAKVEPTEALRAE